MFKDKSIKLTKNKSENHSGQCQYDFPLVIKPIFTGGPRKTVSGTVIDRDTLVCCLNSGHRMYLYKSWHESTLKEMLDLGCLVGEALKEAVLIRSRDIPAKLLSGSDEWDF